METTAKINERYVTGLIASAGSSGLILVTLRVFARYYKANGMQWLITPFGRSPRGVAPWMLWTKKMLRGKSLRVST